ncbi:MAG: hypothetical protein ACSHYF_01520 [Verrucomicrobiaceae bacterium]
MRILLIALLCLAGPSWGEFDVNTVIHPVVQKLEAPRIRPEFSVNKMAISSKSDLAANHVIQGMAHLIGPWDFESYRHFCAAAKADPDCMMAYWGVAMSLAGRKHEFYDQRKAAVDRMLDLLEAGVGTEIEKGYAEAVGHLYANGPAVSGATYLAVSKKFPNDIQSRLWGSFLSRDGYDSSGGLNPGQSKCIEELGRLIRSNPENIPVVAFWVSVQAEGAGSSKVLSSDVLPFARKLARLQPDYPPFHLTLAHLEARCGNASLSIDSCNRAVALYEDYMKSDKVSIYDCGGWHRAKVYAACQYAVKGDRQVALKIAGELAGLEVEAGRVFSEGASLILWEGRTLGGRLAFMGSSKEEFDGGLRLLDQLPAEQWYEEKSLARTYRDALAFCLGTRKALVSNDREGAKKLFQDLIERIKSFDTDVELAKNTSSYSEWMRAKRTLGVLAFELRGLIAVSEEGAMKLAAVNWFRSAIDRQSFTSNLLPPSLNYPVEIRLAEYYLAIGNPEEAAEVYKEANRRIPNHIDVLRGYRSALLKLGKKDVAAKVAAKIEVVKK